VSEVASSFHEEPKKALAPIESTDAGMSMLFSPEQLLKALLPIFFSPSGKLMVAISEDVNAPFFISVIVEGRTKVVALLHRNAFSPMAVTV
jgi:hypothetical protein